eukprot:Clim_evm4s73 gene=Clim_evmTU4s73
MDFLVALQHPAKEHFPALRRLWDRLLDALGQPPSSRASNKSLAELLANPWEWHKALSVAANDTVDFFDELLQNPEREAIFIVLAVILLVLVPLLIVFFNRRRRNMRNQDILKRVNPSATVYNEEAGTFKALHVLMPTDFTQPVYCNVCRQSIFELGTSTGFRGYQCLVCGYSCHEDRTCLRAGEADGRCKGASMGDISTSVIVEDVDSEDNAWSRIRFPHHWRQGNPPLGAWCSVCRRAGVGDVNALAGYHCLWCQADVHSEGVYLTAEGKLMSAQQRSSSQSRVGQPDRANLNGTSLGGASGSRARSPIPVPADSPRMHGRKLGTGGKTAANPQRSVSLESGLSATTLSTSTDPQDSSTGAQGESSSRSTDRSGNVKEAHTCYHYVHDAICTLGKNRSLIIPPDAVEPGPELSAQNASVYSELLDEALRDKNGLKLRHRNETVEKLRTLCFGSTSGGGSMASLRNLSPSATRTGSANESAKQRKSRPASLPCAVRADWLKPDVRPLLVFVNPYSGAQGREWELCHYFYGHLNPCQVLLLRPGTTTPVELLAPFLAILHRCRVLICGGDGTIGWVLNTLDDLGFTGPKKSPWVALCPTGTGNDLARCLGWGRGLAGVDLDTLLQSVAVASKQLMDRWALVTRPLTKQDKDGSSHRPREGSPSPISRELSDGDSVYSDGTGAPPTPAMAPEPVEHPEDAGISALDGITELIGESALKRGNGKATTTQMEEESNLIAAAAAVAAAAAPTAAKEPSPMSPNGSRSLLQPQTSPKPPSAAQSNRRKDGRLMDSPLLNPLGLGRIGPSTPRQHLSGARIAEEVEEMSNGADRDPRRESPITRTGATSDSAQSNNTDGPASRKGSNDDLRLSPDSSGVTVQVTSQGSGLVKRYYKRLALMNNYFSIGVDAAIVKNFHSIREQYPGLFISRWLNKILYGIAGLQDIIEASCAELPEYLDVEIDGVSLPMPEGIQGVVFLNIASYAGGKRPYHGDGAISTAMDDGVFEVFALINSAHTARIQVGFGSVVKLGQGSRLKVTNRRAFPMQVDGEPWVQQPSVIRMSKHSTVGMLRKQESD